MPDEGEEDGIGTVHIAVKENISFLGTEKFPSIFHPKDRKPFVSVLENLS